MNKQQFIKHKKKYLSAAVFFVFLLIYALLLPKKLFNNPVCTVLYDKNYHLLGAHIADDSQWRFPQCDSVPYKFRQCIIQYEDKRFYYHWGVDLLALARAIKQNISSNQIVSGASTIPMQIIRLSRKDKPRTVKEKIIEIILATRIEFRYSKNELLNLYASHAPFGGNVVGLEAASWRYFGRASYKLTWAESAMLAVLPNSPALIHPGRNRNELKQKRNFLLKRLYEKEIIDSLSYQLALEEEIPEKPKAFPQHAPHMLIRAKTEAHKTARVHSSLDIGIQKQVNRIIKRHHQYLEGNQIHNVAALVLEVETGNVIAYAGNAGFDKDSPHGSQVDVIMADRSTGSILKPFLYAAMLHSGDILPKTLIADIPTQIAGYAPKNYNLGYDGAVPARRALARSLNVPAIKMLQQYGVEKFHYLLKKMGMTSLYYPPDHYGLSLILGGCEGKLWDICGIYASMARTLNHFTEFNSRYNKEDFFSPNYLFGKTTLQKNPETERNTLLNAAAIYHTFDAMLTVERPAEESSWQSFSSSHKIAWKTGTSFGFRDAWAIGLTPEYVVGVWAGNADGEGRPGLVGIKTAAPVLFDIFDILTINKSWFSPPYDDMVYTAICHESGYLINSACNHVDSAWIPQTGLRTKACPYHKIIHLDKETGLRVHSDCESTQNMNHESWFVLPPALEWYYKRRNSTYKTLPPYREDCRENMLDYMQSMEIIYPQPNAQIYVPTELNGEPGSTVFEVAHRKPGTKIFWHIDDKYAGTTKDFHHLALRPSTGKHLLKLIDEKGEKITVPFEIIGKKKK